MAIINLDLGKYMLASQQAEAYKKAQEQELANKKALSEYEAAMNQAQYDKKFKEIAGLAEKTMKVSPEHAQLVAAAIMNPGMAGALGTKRVTTGYDELGNPVDTVTITQPNWGFGGEGGTTTASSPRPTGGEAAGGQGIIARGLNWLFPQQSGPGDKKKLEGINLDVYGNPQTLAGQANQQNAVVSDAAGNMASPSTYAPGQISQEISDIVAFGNAGGAPAPVQQLAKDALTNLSQLDLSTAEGQARYNQLRAMYAPLYKAIEEWKAAQIKAEREDAVKRFRDPMRQLDWMR